MDDQCAVGKGRVRFGHVLRRVGFELRHEAFVCTLLGLLRVGGGDGGVLQAIGRGRRGAGG